MESATLTELITKVQRQADVESFASRYPDAAITGWLNEGVTAYRELIGGGSSRVLRTLEEVAVTTSSNQSEQFDFARILAVGMTEDDGQSWYKLEEATSSSDLTRGTDTLSTSTGRPIWWTWDGDYLTWYPKSDRARTLRIVGELTAPVLQDGDTFQSLVPRGCEYVATFAALKLLARDGSQEQYALLSNELGKCEASIKHRAKNFTGGTPCRRDTRAERAQDQRRQIWVWPPYSYP